MLGKPTGRSEEAAWLEVHEALLLEAARLHKPGRSDEAVPLYEMVATFLSPAAGPMRFSASRSGT